MLDVLTKLKRKKGCKRKFERRHFTKVNRAYNEHDYDYEEEENEVVEGNNFDHRLKTTAK